MRPEDEAEEDVDADEIDTEAVSAIAAVLAAIATPLPPSGDEAWRAPAVPPRERRDRGDILKMCKWALSRALAVPLPD